MHGIPNYRGEDWSGKNPRLLLFWKFRKDYIFKDEKRESRKGYILGIDYYDDNDKGDGFILAVNGDRTICRLVLEKDVEKVEIEN